MTSPLRDAPATAAAAEPAAEVRRPAQARACCCSTVLLQPWRSPGAALTRAALQPSRGGRVTMFPPPSDDDEDGYGSPDEEEEGFVALEDLRGVALMQVRVVVGSKSFSDFASYHVNIQPADSNKPGFVAGLAVLWDLSQKNALPYAVGAQAPERGPQAGAWSRGVFPNTLVSRPTNAVVLIPGAVGVGKTTLVRCVRRRHARRCVDACFAAGISPGRCLGRWASS